jgi:glycerophosphoryl diester phosphodiesterase
VARRRFKWLAGVVLGGLALAGALYGSLAWSEGERAADHPYFGRGGRRPLVIAHRGGAGLWPENTLYAFGRAASLGVDVIEFDVRSTADGALVVFHDATVERTTEGRGPVGAMTLDEVKRLDAAYRWTPDGGRTFPLRGSGVRVPTLEEVFAALPEMRFVIEPKRGTSSTAGALCRVVRGRAMTEKVLVASFTQAVLEEFRRECPGVATSAGPGEVSKFLALSKAGLGASYSPSMQAVQIPEYAGGVRVITKGLVEAAHERNLEVHAWTVNDASAMSGLIELGVDGIMTDYPDRLMALLERARPPVARAGGGRLNQSPAESSARPTSP